jgi:alpha-tubulin suppressor-like RCC1 family protein
MSSNQRVTTNFIRSNGVDVAYEFITKDYLMSVYPGIAQELGKTPELWTWGNGNYGLHGANDNLNKSTPVTTFAGGTNWRQVSTSGYNTAAIKTDGTLWIWGQGLVGALGNASLANALTPVTTFSGGTNWKQVSAGRQSMAAIKTDGTLWMWGRGIYGRLGNAQQSDRSTPVTTFSGGTNWKQVSAGYHTAAIKTDGTLWVWGSAYYGQLGNIQTSAKSTPVTTFAGGTNWKQVCVNQSERGSTVAIKTDGTLWTWGRNSFGNLGTNDTIDRSTPVTTFAGGTNWKQASTGCVLTAANFTAATKTDGTLWTWGGGDSGRLGNNQISNRLTPVTTFAGGTNWKFVNCGAQHTAAIKTDGTLWVWGVGTLNVLGINVLGNRVTPVTTFAGGTNWKQVSMGLLNTAAIRSTDFI